MLENLKHDVNKFVGQHFFVAQCFNLYNMGRAYKHGMKDMQRKTNPTIYDLDRRDTYRGYHKRDIAVARRLRLEGRPNARTLERCAHWRKGIAQWSAEHRAGLWVLAGEVQ